MITTPEQMQEVSDSDLIRRSDVLKIKMLGMTVTTIERAVRAIPIVPQPVAVTVKPLVWHMKSEWHFFTDPEPGSPGNSQKMQYVIKHYSLDGGLWDLYGPSHWGPGNKFSSIEAAKAAAQADYEARILSALTIQPADQLSDPRVVALVEACKTADTIARNLGWHRIYDVTGAALRAIGGEA